MENDKTPTPTTTLPTLTVISLEDSYGSMGDKRREKFTKQLRILRVANNDILNELTPPVENLKTRTRMARFFEQREKAICEALISGYKEGALVIIGVSDLKKIFGISENNS